MYLSKFVQNEPFIHPLRKAAGHPSPGAPDKDSPRPGPTSSGRNNRPPNRGENERRNQQIQSKTSSSTTQVSTIGPVSRPDTRKGNQKAESSTSHSTATRSRSKAAAPNKDVSNTTSGVPKLTKPHSGADISNPPNRNSKSSTREKEKVSSRPVSPPIKKQITSPIKGLPNVEDGDKRTTKPQTQLNNQATDASRKRTEKSMLKTPRDGDHEKKVITRFKSPVKSGNVGLGSVRTKKSISTLPRSIKPKYEETS